MSKAPRITSKGRWAAWLKISTWHRSRTNRCSYSKQHLAFARVLFFENQSLAPAAQLAASRWGDININRFFTHVEGARHRAGGQGTAAAGQYWGYWHADHSYDQVPALGSMLLARQVPTTVAIRSSLPARKPLRVCPRVCGDVAFVAGSALVAPRVRRASTLYGRDGGPAG